MNEYPLEDVHRLLGGLEDSLSMLRASNEERIPVEALPEIVEAIHELDGWRNAQYLEKQVGVSSSLLNRFMRLRGSVRRADAIKVADRLRTYLRSQDQSFDQPIADLGARGDTANSSSNPRRSTEVVFAGEQWVAAGSSSQVKMKIAAIASLLDSILDQLVHSNAAPKDQVLTEIERQQLVAILETALVVLRAPLVEKGLLKRVEGVLKRGAESAAEKGVQQGLGRLMEGAGARIMELLALLFG